MKKTLITEAALGILVTSGYKVAQSWHSLGIDNIDSAALGTFVAGVFVLVRRYMQKQEEKNA